MNDYEQCPICGKYYKDYQFEAVFTGRTQKICYKCMKNGRNESGLRLNNPKRKKDIEKMTR